MALAILFSCVGWQNWRNRVADKEHHATFILATLFHSDRASHILTKKKKTSHIYGFLVLSLFCHSDIASHMNGFWFFLFFVFQIDILQHFFQAVDQEAQLLILPKKILAYIIIMDKKFLK